MTRTVESVLLGIAAQVVVTLALRAFGINPLAAGLAGMVAYWFIQSITSEGSR